MAMIIIHNQNQSKTWNCGTNEWATSAREHCKQHNAVQQVFLLYPKHHQCLNVPFVKKTKMIKQSGHRKQQDACIPGQVFHMDLSYISRPSNLDDIISHNAPPEPTIKQSREGYIRFLTIIDVATRKLWTHSVKSKDPSLEYVNSFLKKHGIWQTNPSGALMVTTTKNGYLANS